jgi:hypothetical protein
VSARVRWSLAAALALGLCACATPAEQPRLSVEVTGIRATTEMRLSALGGITLELFFVPRTEADAGPLADGGTAGRPHRRIAPINGEDSLTVTVQVPDGAYTLRAEVSGSVLCPRALEPSTHVLGTSDTSLPVRLPSTAGAPLRLTMRRADLGTLCQ